MGLIMFNDRVIELTQNDKYVALKYSQGTHIVRNLFDKNNLDGTYSNKINVISGQNYKIYRVDTGGFNTQFRQLDAAGAILSDTVMSADGCAMGDNVTHLQVNTFGNNDIKNNAVIIEGTHCYTEYTGFNEPTECLKSKWNGKRWLVLGDSISTGNGVLASYHFASEPYHYLIAKEKGIITTNLAVSGYTTRDIVEKKVNNLSGDYYPDLITIFAGVNDINFSCDTNVWYEILLEKLKEKYPASTIGVILPLDYSASDDRLLEKLNTIKSKADKYGIKYLNMYQKTGWDFKNENDVLTYTCNGDGLHPNNLGHTMIKPQIDEFLESL